MNLMGDRSDQIILKNSFSHAQATCTASTYLPVVQYVMCVCVVCVCVVSVCLCVSLCVCVSVCIYWVGCSFSLQVM